MDAKKPTESLIWSRAVKVAALKVRIKTVRQLERLLEEHGFTAAEAYELGVQEAQQEIVRRLSLVADKTWQKTNTANLKERPTQETPAEPTLAEAFERLRKSYDPIEVAPSTCDCDRSSSWKCRNSTSDEACNCSCHGQNRRA